MSETFTVGDAVELVDDVPGRKELKAGRRAVVVVGNDADDGDVWHLCSIVLGTNPEHGRVWLVHGRHLRKVEEAA
jgi:hypothetical protein